MSVINLNDCVCVVPVPSRFMSTPHTLLERRRSEYSVLVKGSVSFWDTRVTNNPTVRREVRGVEEQATYKRIKDAVSVLYGWVGQKNTCGGGTQMGAVMPLFTEEPMHEAIILSELLFVRLRLELARGGIPGLFEHEVDPEIKWLYQVAHTRPEVVALVALTLARLWGDEEKIELGIDNKECGLRFFHVLDPVISAELNARSIHCARHERLMTQSGARRGERHGGVNSANGVQTMHTVGASGSDSLLLAIGDQLCEIYDSTMHTMHPIKSQTKLVRWKAVVGRMQRALALHSMNEYGRVTTEQTLFVMRCDLWDAVALSTAQPSSKKRRYEQTFAGCWNESTRRDVTRHVHEYINNLRQTIGPHALSPMQLVDEAVDSYVDCERCKVDN